MLAIVNRAIQCQGRGWTRCPNAFAQPLGDHKSLLKRHFLDLQTDHPAGTLGRGQGGVALIDLVLAKNPCGLQVFDPRA